MKQKESRPAGGQKGEYPYFTNFRLIRPIIREALPAKLPPRLGDAGVLSLDVYCDPRKESGSAFRKMLRQLEREHFQTYCWPDGVCAAIIAPSLPIPWSVKMAAYYYCRSALEAVHLNLPAVQTPVVVGRVA